MAAPTFANYNGGQVLTASGALSGLGGVTVGQGVILHALQDGTGANMTLTDTNSTIEALDGTDNTMTPFPGNPYQVGNPAAAKLFLWIGRATATSLGGDVVTSAGDDLYLQLITFNNMNTGTALTDVIENATAGTAAAANGTSTTVSDVGVTTLGADRLACNFIGINDDATGLAAFAGETGGDWILPVGMAIFGSATGTDGTIALFTAAMAAAGTIDGGSDTITSDGWGVVGFALIGTTGGDPAKPPELVRIARYGW